MIKFLFLAIGFFSLLTNTSFAGSDDFDSWAYRICTSFANEWYRVNCLDQIKGKQFDHSVINICRNQIYDLDKQRCLGIIENKKYLDGRQIHNCRSQIYDTDKNICLQEASTAPM